MSNTFPRVSVVIPAYNAELFIAQAVSSVLAQTFADWELIVVDDGSTDDTASRVAPFLCDPRISLHRKANGGPASARNAGIRLAMANFIALLDADDYWLPRKLERQMAVMAQYPDVGVCGAASTVVSQDGEVVRHVMSDGFHGSPFPRLLFGPLADMTTALIRRKVFEQVGFFDETLRFSEDYEFWLRVGTYFCFHIIPEHLVCYRSGHASTAGPWKERREYFHSYILPRFLNEQGGRQLVRRRHVLKLKGRHYKYRGDESDDTFRRLGWYLRSIAIYPFSLDAYSATAAALTPAPIWRLFKTMTNKVFYCRHT